MYLAAPTLLVNEHMNLMGFLKGESDPNHFSPWCSHSKVRLLLEDIVNNLSCHLPSEALSWGWSQW
jgi:hypothetical protein